MKLTRKLRTDGFTLVELLVVIVIIAALAALSVTVGPKMLKKARATEAMQNMRQLGPLITTYASDHEMRLPAAKGPALQSDGSTTDLQWNEVCLAMLFPDSKPADLKSQAWWDKNKTMFKNPLFKASTPLKPGYGLNQMIPENVAIASGAAAPSQEELLTTQVPLAAITEPSSTPLIAPFNNYTYRFDAAELKGFVKPPLKDLMSDDKLPILFLDGHVESVSPSDYTARKLSEAPKVPTP